jgi:hypothetical protein
MAVPSTAPAALLIDNGELEQFAWALRRMGIDYVRLEGAKFVQFADRPRDLLVTTWEKAQHLPRLQPDGADAWDPIWVCVHRQDFLPLRQRMRAMGIHFLVNPALHHESLRLLIEQLLYRGAERRGAPRLPIGCQAGFRTESSGRGKALLAEISEDGARLLSSVELRPDDAIAVTLPVELGLGQGVELRGRVVRCSRWEPDGADPAWSIVLHFDSLEPDHAMRLTRLLGGHQLGGRVTPLESPPERVEAPLLDSPQEPVAEPTPVRAPAATRPAPASAPEPAEPRAAVPRAASSPDEAPPDIALDRRGVPRGDYRRAVPALWSAEGDAPDVVVGYDLSRNGMRIAWHPELTVGDRFGVAIHGSAREEPLVLQAEIVRDDGVSGFGLRFVDLGEEDGQRLDALLESLALLEPVESLCEGDPDGQNLVVSRLLR